MKKIILIASIIVLVFLMSNKVDKVIIPSEAIRFRVIANSNQVNDQEAKLLVRDRVQKQIINDLQASTNLEEARTNLSTNLEKYNKLVELTLKENQIDEDYQVNYGMNYFPKKVYKGVTYEEGNYESLVVTLGNGLGDNWWCVLFPPLCLLEAEETEEKTEVEYKFFIQELIEKYL